MRRGLNVDIPEGGLLEDHSVVDTIESHSTGQTYRLLTGLLENVPQDGEIVLFEHGLRRRSQIGVSRQKLAARRARGAEDLDHAVREHASELRRPVLPGHR